jgi:S-adenosylmethionine:tRNA ribosyltransferase-isomerase
MHSERYTIPPETSAAIARAKALGNRVIAVGTTSVRSLEDAARLRGDGTVAAGSRWTDLFIYPGFEFRVVDALITNFHLPRSTLLMLVCAFAGTEEVLNAYDVAARERYRFYSFGDAMFIAARATPRSS